MPFLCGLLQFDHWEFSTLKKVLFFLNTPQALHLGAGANAIRELSGYFEFGPIEVIYDFGLPCFKLGLVGSFFIWNEVLSTSDEILFIFQRVLHH